MATTKKKTAKNKAKPKSKTKTEVEKLSLEDEIILSCAFRYALGRMTYVVSTVVDRLINSYDALRDSTRERIAKEISDAAEAGNLGSECDVVEWERVRCLFTPHLHFQVKAWENEDKKGTPEIKHAVLMYGNYYDLDMKRRFHQCEAVKPLFENKSEDVSLLQETNAEAEQADPKKPGATNDPLAKPRSPQGDLKRQAVRRK